MRFAFALVLFAHGLIHLIGFAKAFGLADLPLLTAPISQFFGMLWLTASLLFVAAAEALFLWPRGWWAIAAAAIVVSTIAIIPSWADAGFVMAGDLIALIGVAFGFFAHGPGSLRAAFERDVDRGLSRVTPAATLTDTDIAHLPPPVQRYLVGAGVVGLPSVRNFRVRMHGRIRSGPDEPWIPITAEQYTFVDEPARLFYFTGSMRMIPIQGYHRYVGASATMEVKAAAIAPVVRASGREMDEGETVTMFNDMCVMAPATLISRAIAWEPVDARTVRASFTNGGHTIRAELTFNDAGELANFQSDDRYQISPAGRSAKKVRWSTPLDGYRSFAGVRLASGGEARWHEEKGEYVYIELTYDDVHYNVRSREA